VFTGLVEDIGTIQRIAPRRSGMELSIGCGLPVHEIKPGDSIAVDGACLTVTSMQGQGFSADVSSETLQRTTLGKKRPADRVNLERALRLGDRLGGHIVSGHIDGIAVLGSRDKAGEFTRLTFSAAEHLLKYIIEKGSVAIDGISLTVNTVTGSGFSVMIIPHTLEQTTLAVKKPGDRVNIENDIIGKYVEKLMEKQADARSGITLDFLAKHNFT
jgi:riboflavin synthase